MDSIHNKSSCTGTGHLIQVTTFRRCLTLTVGNAYTLRKVWKWLSRKKKSTSNRPRDHRVLLQVHNGSALLVGPFTSIERGRETPISKRHCWATSRRAAVRGPIECRKKGENRHSGDTSPIQWSLWLLS